MFISYRRSDSGTWVDTLESTRRSRLAGLEIFRDVASIDSGENWLQKIEQAIGNSRLMVIMIGPNWLSAEKDGVRRLDDPDDIVRREVALGLQERLDIVPVLVDDATFPDADALPSDIRNLAWINAHVFGKPDGDRSVAELVRRIGSLLGVRVQEQQSKAGRALANEVLEKIEALAGRDPEAKNFAAYWQWFLEAKPVLLSAATGTEVVTEINRIVELLTEARGEDDVGRELAID